MKDKLRCSPLEINKTGDEDYGVFATETILSDTIIEEACVLLIHRDSINDELKEHIFTWDDIYDAIALGFASLYNHSQAPNAKYYRDSKNQILIIKAIKNIAVGEEIVINYGSDRIHKTQAMNLPLAQNITENIVRENREPPPVTPDEVEDEEQLVEEKGHPPSSQKKEPPTPAKQNYLTTIIIPAIIYLVLIVAAAYILFFI